MGNDVETAMDANGLISELQKFDLSKEEAEIYLCLLKNKIMTVREINQSIPHIQRTYLYNFLDKLKNNDWVHINKASKPTTFNPYPPSEVLAKKLDQKRKLLLFELEEVNKLEESILPNLLDKLNVIHQKNSLKHIPVEYKDIIAEYFKDNPSIRIEYSHMPLNINPYLNIFFMASTFHGFFISWHKKPISEEYAIHFYEFEKPITETHLTLATKVLELQAQDMMNLLSEREGIDQMQPMEQAILKINAFELTQETISYKKYGKIYEAVFIRPWQVNQNTLAFFYSNLKEEGLKFLKFIVSMF